MLTAATRKSSAFVDVTLCTAVDAALVTFVATPDPSAVPCNPETSSDPHEIFVVPEYETVIDVIDPVKLGFHHRNVLPADEDPAPASCTHPLFPAESVMLETVRVFVLHAMATIRACPADADSVSVLLDTADPVDPLLVDTTLAAI
jgi:hypothetical protein